MRLVKKSFSLSGHRTSVALEAEFWAVLERAARKGDTNLLNLVRDLDAVRGERPLASTLRLHALAAAAAEQ